MSAIARRDAPGALALAKTWRDDQPTDVLAIVGLANHGRERRNPRFACGAPAAFAGDQLVAALEARA